MAGGTQVQQGGNSFGAAAQRPTQQPQVQQLSPQIQPFGQPQVSNNVQMQPQQMPIPPQLGMDVAPQQSMSMNPMISPAYDMPPQQSPTMIMPNSVNPTDVDQFKKLGQINPQAIPPQLAPITMAQGLRALNMANRPGGYRGHRGVDTFNKLTG